MDKRHQRRIKTVQDLYSLFYSNSKRNLSSPLVETIVSYASQLDNYIDEFAKQHNTEELAKTDLAILRLSVYDLIYEKKLPPKVVINEAVELSKELSGDKSYGFINAVLGNVYSSRENQKK